MAGYVPVRCAKQRVSTLVHSGAITGDSFRLVLDTTACVLRTRCVRAAYALQTGSVKTPAALSWDCSALDVKQALEGLADVRSVDVARAYLGSGQAQFDVTLRATLGPVRSSPPRARRAARADRLRH